MPKKVKLKIFGERNTGTNYLSELINSNLDVHLLQGSLNKNSLFTFREWSKDLYFYMTSFYNFGWNSHNSSKTFNISSHYGICSYS